MLLKRRAAEMRTTKDDEMEGLDTREDDEEDELEVWERSRGFISESFVSSHGNKRETDPVSLAQLRALQLKPAASLPIPSIESYFSTLSHRSKALRDSSIRRRVRQSLPLSTPPSEPRTLPVSLDQPASSTVTPEQEPSSQTSTLLFSPPCPTSPQTHSTSSEPAPQRRHLSTPSPLRRTSAILVSSQTPSSFDLLQTPFSPPPTTKRSASDPTPPKPEDGVASSSIKPHLLFPQRRTSRAPPPLAARPLQSSPTTQKTNSSSISTIQITHPAPSAPTPSLVNSSSNKRPINASLLAPSKKPRPTTNAHVSFLLPSNAHDKENEAVELDLLGYKIVIGMDVQGEETREKLEEDVEVLGGEISVRTCKEDWEGDDKKEEGRKVVLICWRKGGEGEGTEGSTSAAAREEVEAAIKTEALLRTHLWISSLKHPFSANLPEVTHQPREASVPGFEDFKICVTDYRDHHPAIIIALVHLAGATYSRPLTDRCTHLLRPPDALRLRTTGGSTPTKSPKLTQAKKRALTNPGSIRIVRDGKTWLERCLVNGRDDQQLADVEMERVERAVAEAAAGGAMGVGGSGSETMGVREDDEVSLSGSLKGLMLG